MNKIKVRAIGREIKVIEYRSNDDVEKVIDYASFIIINASYTLFNGECLVKVNGRNVTSEDELRELLRKLIKENEDIIVEILQMKKEITSKRLPSEIVLHAASITPPMIVQR